MPFHVADIAFAELFLVGIVAFLSSILGGVSGYGVGLILPVFLAPVVGVAAVVPVMSVAMAITNLSRAVVFRRDVALWASGAILALGVPCALLSAIAYTFMSPRAIAVFVGGFLVLSIPTRRILERQQFRIGGKGMVAVGAAYGLLSGGMVGIGGLLLISSLMSAGMRGAGLVGTDASVSVIINLVKSAVFGKAALLDVELVLFGLMIGLCTVPGAVVARWLLKKIPLRIHTAFMDLLVVAGGVSFVVQGFV